MRKHGCCRCWPAGLAMSAHLRDQHIDHVVLERDSIAERWRNARWDSLVMNGPAARSVSALCFDSDPDGFPGKDEVTVILKILPSR